MQKLADLELGFALRLTLAFLCMKCVSDLTIINLIDAEGDY